MSTHEQVTETSEVSLAGRTVLVTGSDGFIGSHVVERVLAAGGRVRAFCLYTSTGGLGWLEVECNRCKTRASLPLDAIRRPRDTPIWKLEAALKCRSCRKGPYAPPVHMIKLTETHEITPYVWVHLDEER